EPFAELPLCLILYVAENVASTCLDRFVRLKLFDSQVCNFSKRYECRLSGTNRLARSAKPLCVGSIPTRASIVFPPLLHSFLHNFDDRGRLMLDGAFTEHPPRSESRWSPRDSSR